MIVISELALKRRGEDIPMYVYVVALEITLSVPAVM
jgi:hypothetical protein